MPIIKDIFQKFISNKPINITNLNINTTFKVAWAGFIRLGKITYMATEAKKPIFKKTKLTRLDILLTEGNQYTILQLKQSKTNIKHTGIQIVLADTSELICLVLALGKLFIQDPRLVDTPLFRLSFRVFSY